MRLNKTINPKTATIFKRKGNSVRYIDPDTLVISGWVQLSTPKPAPAKPKARKVDYSKMLKSELQELARTRGIKFTTKTTNKALAEALSAS